MSTQNNKEIIEKKYMCNYHFITECHDLNKTPEKADNTKCSGLNYKDSIKGITCNNGLKENNIKIWLCRKCGFEIKKLKKPTYCSCGNKNSYVELIK